jgi:hypothetical protein
MASVKLSIANAHPLLDPWDATLRARIGNEEQACPEGTTGDSVLPGVVFQPTLASANATAATMLVCVLSWPWEVFDSPTTVSQDVVWSSWAELDI